MKKISRSIKQRVYKTIIRPTVVYGCEAWVLNKKLEEKLLRRERKIFRRIYGGKKVGEGYERRVNKEIYDLYGEADILEVIKGRRLEW